MWRSFCETLGRQGQTAALFIFAVLGFVLLAPLAGQVINSLRRNDIDPWDRFYLVLILAVPILSFLTWLLLRLRRNRRNRQRDQTASPIVHPLAYEEIRRARGKLVHKPK